MFATETAPLSCETSVVLFFLDLGLSLLHLSPCCRLWRTVHLRGCVRSMSASCLLVWPAFCWASIAHQQCNLFSLVSWGSSTSCVLHHCVLNHNCVYSNLRHSLPYAVSYSQRVGWDNAILSIARFIRLSSISLQTVFPVSSTSLFVFGFLTSHTNDLGDREVRDGHCLGDQSLSLSPSLVSP